MASFFLHVEKRFGFEITKRKILQFAANQTHPQSVSDRRIYVQRFAGDALLLGRIQIVQRAHVVQAVGQFHHHHPNIVDHGQQHLADILGLARFRSEQVEPADFGGAFHQARHIRAEMFGDRLQRNFGVFDHIVQQRGANGRNVQFHVREDVRDFHRMGKERLARQARLGLMLFGGEIVSAAEELEVVARTVAADLVHQLDETKVNGAAGGFGNRRFRCGFHG